MYDPVVHLCVQAGFNHDYGCVYKDVPEYEHLIRVLPRCFTEVMLRVANPLRPIFPTWFKGGDKVRTRADATRPTAVHWLRGSQVATTHQAPPSLVLAGVGAQVQAAFHVTLPAPTNDWPRSCVLRCLSQGAKAFAMFQDEMRTLLNEMKARGEPEPEDQDIAAQLYRVMNDNPAICENRILSEIGMLFVEGFETTGAYVNLLWGKQGRSSSSAWMGMWGPYSAW